MIEFGSGEKNDETALQVGKKKGKTIRKWRAHISAGQETLTDESYTNEKAADERDAGSSKLIGAVIQGPCGALSI